MEKLDLLSVERLKETKTETTSNFNADARDQGIRIRPGSNTVHSSGIQYDTTLLK